MSVAFELEFEACRTRLYALPDPPARTAPSPWCAAAGWSWARWWPVPC